MQINFFVDNADSKRYAATLEILQVLRSHHWLQLPFSFLSFIRLMTKAFLSSVTTKWSRIRRGCITQRTKQSEYCNNNNGHLQESDGGRNE